MPNAHELTVAIASIIQCQIVQVCALCKACCAAVALKMSCQLLLCVGLAVGLATASLGSSAALHWPATPAARALHAGLCCWI